MEYRLLGPVEVCDGGRSLPLAGAKQRALLALLLLNANRVISRDRLIDELWGDEPPETAVTSIQVYVSRLRKLLPPDALVTRPPGYLLRAEAEQIDLHRFERLVADARKAEPERAARLLRDALALWRGPALGEFREPFAQIESARLEDLRLAALEERIDADLTLGRHGELIGELEALIAEHPHRERPRGQLMLALYRSGRQAEALETYRDTREALDALGIEPSERLRELERSILMQDTALAIPAPLVSGAVELPGPLRTRAPFPFVGREKELNRLGSLLALAASGEGGQVVLIGGEAGSGKTRLARELAHEAAERGTLVLYGAAYADVNVPYQPFVEALEFLMRFSDPGALDESIGGGREDLARLLPGLGDSATPPATDPQTARRRLHNAIGELFARVSRERPVLLVVDDIHWADTSSLELLRHLTREVPEARILLLATYRDRSEDVRPELTTALADLARQEGITRIGVMPLRREHIAEFIVRSSGASPTSELTEAIGSLTDGTPFLLCELWRALVDADSLEVSDAGVGLTRPVGELSSPESVRDVVHYRLSRLAPATTAMLEVAAVAGPEFELKLLGDDATVPSAAHEATEKGVLDAVSDPGTGYRFTHELVRRALYDRLTSVRRAQLHLQVGESLERLHGTNVDLVLAELAHHFTRASGIDGVERAIDYNVRTAAAAASLFAYDQVAERLSIALELGIADTSRRASVELDLGTALHYTGKLAEAETMLARAVDDSLSTDADDLRAHASIVHHHVRMRTDRQAAQSAVRSVAQEAIDVFNRSGDHGGLAQAWRLLSHAAILECQWGEANEALDVALDHAKSTADRRECPTVVAWLLSAVYYGPTPPLEGIQRYEELVALCAGHPNMEAATACNRAALLAMIGRFEEAHSEGQRGLATLEALGMSVHATACRAPVWDAEFLAGDTGAAERELLTAHEASAAAGDHAAAVSFAFDLAWLLCLQERYSEAEEWTAGGRSVLETMDVMVRLIGFGVEAELAASKGEIQIADQFARRAVELAEAADAPCIGARAYVSVSRALQLASRGEDAAAAHEKAAVLYESKGNVTAAAQLRTAALSSTDSSRSRRIAGGR